MRATVMYGAHDVRVEIVPDARLVEPTDALVRVTRACICGSDLWPYNSMPASATGNRMGHEFVGVVEVAVVEGQHGEAGPGERLRVAGQLIPGSGESMSHHDTRSQHPWYVCRSEHDAARRRPPDVKFSLISGSRVPSDNSGTH